MTFNTILPGAWELTQDLEYNLFSLIVPTAWQQVAKSLAQKRATLLGKRYPSVPVYSLDRIIAASFPQIIQTVRYGWQHPGATWLFATEKADLSDLSEFIKDWLREEFSTSLGEAEVDSCLEKLDARDWHWKEPKTYSLLRQPEHPYDEIRFQAIPDYLAVEFLKNPQVCFGENDRYQLTFYRVVSLNKGAELMSWPPHSVSIEKNQEVGTADISFVIRFKLQTVPWRREPIIYHQLSIRRWIVEQKESLPYRGATAFIGDNRRWLDGVRQPFCFMPLPVKKRSGGKLLWPKAISGLLLTNDSPLPDPKELVKQPKYNWSAFGQEPEGIQIAIAYDTRHRGDAPCLPGVSPLDLASIDRAIQNQIEQSNFPIKRVGEATKVKSTNKKSTKNQGQKNFWELTGAPKTPMLRAEIAAPAVFSSAENPLHTILILWETKECRDRLISEICKLLSLSEKGDTQIYKLEVQGEKTIYESPLGSLQIKTQHVEDLTQRLDLDSASVKTNDRQKQRVNIIEERVSQIVSSLPKAEGISGALIEIKSKKSFFPRESDPKLALRIGAMQAGYVNQHIHAVTAHNKKGEKYKIRNSPHRVQKAVSDLLRQFGILPAPIIDLEKDGIDPNLWLTCFQVLRRTRKTTASNTPATVALMVRVNPLTGTVQVTTPSLFPTWVSYPVGLGHLIKEKWDSDSDIGEITSDIGEGQQSSDKKREQQFLNKFVADCLKDCLNTPIEKDKLPRLLFLAEAQNARKMLAWLQNPKLPANNLPDELKRHMTESEQNRLWVVRLRIAGEGEVPVCIIKDSPGSRTSGLFCWDGVCDGPENALYLSMRKNLTTEQDLLRLLQSRLDNGSRQAGNPKPLEIAVVHSPGIEASKLACFVHNLRDRWPYFADEVSLSFPFPFATLAKEYAVSAKDRVELEESEESEESEDLEDSD